MESFQTEAAQGDLVGVKVPNDTSNTRPAEEQVASGIIGQQLISRDEIIEGTGLTETSSQPRYSKALLPIRIMVALLLSPLFLVMGLGYVIFMVITFIRLELVMREAKRQSSRYEVLRLQVDIDGAISCYQKALGIIPGHWNNDSKVVMMNNIASCMYLRHQQTGSLQDLGGALYFAEEALELSPPGHTLRGAILCSFGTYLLTKHQLTGDINDLELAIQYHQQGLSLQPRDGPDRAAAMNNLASSLEERYKQQNDVKDLESALEYNQQALLQLSPNDPRRSTILHDTASWFYSQFKISNDIKDLEEAILRYQHALEFRPDGHPDRPITLGSLAACVATRYEKAGDNEDREGAIKNAQEALRHLPDTHPLHSIALSNLAACLFTRYEDGGNLKDLEEAIQYTREALSAGRGDPVTLVNLGSYLESRFEQKGEIGDRDQAIDLIQEALASLSPMHTMRATALRNFAACLHFRFLQESNPKDLIDAIDYLSEALTLEPYGKSDASLTVTHLSNCLWSYTIRIGGDTADLNKTIHRLEGILPLQSPGQRSLPNIKVCLAKCRWARYEKLGDIKDLQDGIQNFRDALLLYPSGSLFRIEAELGLAQCFHAKYKKVGDEKDLEEAIRLVEDTLHNKAHAPVTVVTRMELLAQLYIAQSDLQNCPERRDVAMQLFQTAVDNPSVSVLARLNICYQWSKYARGAELVTAYRRCLELADRYILTLPSISSRHQQLAFLPPSLPSDAAAAAISTGNLRAAVELLEQGRSMLWTQMGRYCTPIDKIRDEAIAIKFQDLSQQLEIAATTLGPTPSESRAVTEEKDRRYRKLLEEWDTTLTLIRNKIGLESFLKAPSFPILKKAASNGPIIIVNISSIRSDCIILGNEEEPFLIPLPDVCKEHIVVLASQFLGVATVSLGRSQRSKLTTILQRLWEDIVQPVVFGLEKMRTPKNSHIWWCPTAQLTSLPLHAAGSYGINEPNLPDLYVSSYTPTLAALIRASNPGRSSLPSVSSLLVIAQPSVPKYPEIKEVLKEVEEILQVIPSINLLMDKNGTINAVLDTLPAHRWIHFACHGFQNVQEPFKSRFILHDGSLTLLDIVRRRLPNTEFAYLSACHSAAGSVNVPDEAIHLAAGLQFSGVRSVIGTIYTMADIDGPIVAEVVYKHLTGNTGAVIDFRKSAEALNIATKALRKKHVPVERWINFVHIGA